MFIFQHIQVEIKQQDNNQDRNKEAFQICLCCKDNNLFLVEQKSRNIGQKQQIFKNESDNKMNTISNNNFNLQNKKDSYHTFLIKRQYDKTKNKSIIDKINYNNISSRQLGNFICLLDDKYSYSQFQIKWAKNIEYELIKDKKKYQINRITKNSDKSISIQQVQNGVLNTQIRNMNKMEFKKTIRNIENSNYSKNEQFQILGGGQCGGKSVKSNQKKSIQDQRQKLKFCKRQSILIDEMKNKHQQEKQNENYTYQMNEEQLQKAKVIFQKLHFEIIPPPEQNNYRYVSILFSDIYEIFSSVLSKGIIDQQTSLSLQQLLEVGVNFLLSLIYASSKQKLELFDQKVKEKILEKIKRTYKLFKSYENRLPLQVHIFLLRYQKKVIQLQRKQISDNPSNKTFNFEDIEWNKQFIKFCYGGFQDRDFSKLQDLISSLSIYYEFNTKQKFVVDLLKTELNIIKKYSDVVQKKIEFEDYFETILKDYENKSYSQIFHTYLILYDQIIDNSKNLNEVENVDPKKAVLAEIAIHFIKLVTGDTFIELCRNTFYFNNLKQCQQRKQLVNQLSENFSLRYIELKILVQTYKLIKIFESKNNLSEVFSGTELNNLERLEANIFEKFLLESSCEVNCLIYDDEEMLKLIELLNIQIDDTYYTQLSENLKVYKQNLEKFIINQIQDEDFLHQCDEKESQMIDQLLGRKITYSIAINDPEIAISNRFIEALINRISTKKNESQHEKGSTISVNQRLKFISSNQLSQCDINIDGIVEDGLYMLENYFLVQSNTQINVVAIKGSPGIGKTNLCRQLSRRLLKKIQDTGSRQIAIPIMVEMIEVENTAQHSDLESFLNSSIQRYAFRSSKEIQHLKNSTIPKVIILDGLSEWAWGSPAVSIRDWIRLREWSNTKLIITYRKPFVRAEEFPYFFGQKCKQPQDYISSNMSNSFNNGVLQSRDFSSYKKISNFYTTDFSQSANIFLEDDREKCFEVFQLLSLSQDNIEDYLRQKELQVRSDVRGRGRTMSIMSSFTSMTNLAQSNQTRNRNLTIMQEEIQPGFLQNVFRACTRQNTHLISMLELPFNLFCFAEIIAKVQGIKEIYWGGGGTREERKQAATWLTNQEQMQEKLFIEEISGLIVEGGIEEPLSDLIKENCIEFFQSLAMNLFVERKFKVTLYEIQNLVSQQMKNISNKGATKQEINSFEKIIVVIVQNIHRTSFLASSDLSFFQFVNGLKDDEENQENEQEISSLKDLELNFGQKGGQSLAATSQLYSFRNTPWLEFLIARAMKYDFDKFGNTLHNLSLQELQKFAINTRYLLEERSVCEHNPFSISQQTNHASVEMSILKKLATIIRKDLLDEDFQHKLNQKDITIQHRYIQMIQRTRRKPRKFNQDNQQVNQSKNNLKVSNANDLEEWVVKHEKHPLDIASSNLLSAICFNKLTLSNVKLRNCSFSRAYLYGYRGELDIACSDVSESNLRGSQLDISRSKIQHCLQDDEKNNHESWNSAYAYTYSTLHFSSNNQLICGSQLGSLSIFQPKEQQIHQQNKQKETKKEGESKIINTLQITDPIFKPMQFWQMTSYQRHFQEEVRAIVTFQGDIYYAFLNIIARVTEQGEEKELVVGHQNKINDMCISEKHSTLATVSSDHTIRIWGIFNPELLKKQNKKQPKDEKKQSSPNQNPNCKIGFTPMTPEGLQDEELDEQKDEDVEESFAEMELLHTLNRHDAEVACCSYSSNGLYLATGSYDQQIYVWDISSNYEKTISLTIKQDWITSLQFSSDSSMLVAGSSQCFIKIWNATDKEFPVLQQITTRKQRRDSMILGNPINKNDCIGGISCVRLSPNNKFLIFATFDEPGLQVWELIQKSSPREYMPSPTKRFIFLDDAIMSSHYSTQRMSYFLVNYFSFSPDGKHIAISSQNQTICSIWNIDENFKPPKQSKNGLTGNEVQYNQQQIKPSPVQLQGVVSPNKVSALAITNDGRYMATCSGLASPHKDSCRITIWCTMKRGGQAMIMQILDAGLHSSAVTCLSFSPDNQYLVSASEDEHFVVWRNVSSHFDSTQLFTRQDTHDKRRFSILNPRASVTTASNYSSQYLLLEPFKQVSAHKASISSIAFSCDNRYLVTTSAKEKSCKVWDAHTFEFSHQIQWEEELAICKLEFSSNGQYLATLPLPSVVTNVISAIYQDRKGGRKIAVQRRQSMIRPNPNENINIEYKKKETVQQNQNENQRSSCCFIWNASERFSYYGIVGTVKSKEGFAFTTQIISMCFSKNSQLFVTGQTNGLCVVWNAQNRFNFLQTIDAHFSGVNHITFSGDSQMFASTSFDQTCKIWHVPNRFHEVSSFYTPCETSDIQFVRQGHSIAVTSTSDEFCMKFVDVFSPNYRVEELRSHSGTISLVKFSNDGRFLLTASRDNTVRIWDLKNYFFQHYTINLKYGQNNHQKQENNLIQSQQEQEQNQDDSKQRSVDLENSYRIGDTRYREITNSSMKTKDSFNQSICFSTGDLECADFVIETQQDDKQQNQKNQQQSGRKQKRKLSIFAAPNLKPSQIYQQKIKEIHKDENIEEEDYDDSIGGILTAAISEKGTFVFVVTKEESKHVKLYDFTRGVDDVRESIILDHNDSITCLTLSVKDEYIATGCSNTEIYIWKRTSLSPLTCEFELEKVIEGRHTKAISCVAFSPNLKYFASGSWDITCKVYDVSNNFSLVHVLDGQYGYILSLAFSPCSTRISVTSRDSSCNVWDIENRLLQEEFFDHRQAIPSCSYSPQYLATVSKDKSFMLYDIKDEYKISGKMENLPSQATDSCLSPDGKYLAIGYQNSLVQIWDLHNTYDLTCELMSDPKYQQVLEMEKSLKIKEGNYTPQDHESICNFMNDEDIKEYQQNSLPPDDSQSQHDEFLNKIPTMKNEIIQSVLKKTYQQYKDNNNLKFDVQYTQDNRILVNVQKYPFCAVTL